MHCNKSFTILLLFSLTFPIPDGCVAKPLMFLLVSPVKDILLSMSKLLGSSGEKPDYNTQGELVKWLPFQSPYMTICMR